MGYEVRELKSVVDFKAMDSLVYKSSGSGFMQYTSWLNSYENIGFRTRIWGVFSAENVLMAGVGLLTLRVPLTNWFLACAPHGPSIKAGSDTIFSSAWPELLRRWREAHLVQIHFQTCEEKNQCPVADLLSSLGATERITFRGVTTATKSVCIELKGLNAECVLKSFRRQTRYEIRKGLRSGIEIKHLKTKSEIEVAWNVFKQSAVLKGYPFRPKKMFMESAVDIIGAGNGILFGGYKDKSLLGITLGILTKKRLWYFASARTPAGIKSGVSYVLLWNIIEAAIEKQCEYVDLGGATHPGLRIFKRGFRPRDYYLAEPRSLVFNKKLFYMYSRIEPKLRKHRYRIAEIIRWVSEH